MKRAGLKLGNATLKLGAISKWAELVIKKLL